MLYVTRKKLEFSKKIFIGVTAVTISVIIFTLLMIWRTNDLSPLMYLIPSVFAEMGAATGFYFNKAKAENEIKLSKGHLNNEESEVYSHNV